MKERMTMHKITGATLIAFPGAIMNYVREHSSSKYTNFTAYLWLDDDKALYIHGNTGYGRTTGNIMGRFAEQIGTEYFADSKSVLGGDSLIEGLQRVQSVQIDSKDVAWNGTMDEFLELLGLVKKDEEKDKTKDQINDLLDDFKIASENIMDWDANIQQLNILIQWFEDLQDAMIDLRSLGVSKKLDEIVDLTSLGVADEFKDRVSKYSEYPIWACDFKGVCLVGDDFIEYEHISNIEKYYKEKKKE